MDKKKWTEDCSRAVEDWKETIMSIAGYLHDNPELGKQEYLAAAYLRNCLGEEGFTVTDCVPEAFPTAFEAVKGTGPVHIGFLAEYDALPEIGHGCGHNLIAAMSLGAAVAVAHVIPEEVTVHVYGCPAEETAASKAYMSEHGVFDGLAAALIIHPGETKTTVGGTSYATHPLAFTFTGKPAHIADPVYHGVNALDSAVDFYQALQAYNQRLQETHIIGAIITEGGTAPNIVPSKAVIKATIRAMKADYLETVMLPEIRTLAQRISDDHGTELSMVHYEPLLMDMVNDPRLDVYFCEAFAALGEGYEIVDDDYAEGSTDVGNVSHITRTSQPSLSIGKGISAHTPEFAAAAGSSYGMAQAIKGAKAMAFVAVDVATEKNIKPVELTEEERAWVSNFWNR